MQITLNEVEVTTAIKEFVKNRGLSFRQEPKVTFETKGSAANRTVTAAIDFTEDFTTLMAGQQIDVIGKVEKGLPEGFMESVDEGIGKTKPEATEPSDTEKLQTAGTESATEPVNTGKGEESKPEQPVGGTKPNLFSSGNEKVSEPAGEADELTEEEEPVNSPSEATRDNLFAGRS